MMDPGTQFDADEYSRAYPDGIQNDFWNTARNALIDSVLRRYGLDQILDVGCGRGIVVDHLLQRGFDARGVELGTARPIREGLPVRYGLDATALPESDRLRVRTLLLLDVIEHLESPIELMRRLLESMPRARHVLITVPARMELWSNYDDYYKHFTRYDMPRMREVLVSLGLRPLKMQYMFHSLYPPMLLARYLAGNRSVDLRAPEGAAARLLHRILGGWMYLESRVLPRRLAGTSLLALAVRG